MTIVSTTVFFNDIRDFMNLYIGNLAHAATEDQLKKHFEQFGQVLSAKIITDKFTGSSRGFAFVTMGSAAEGQAAIDGLNGREFLGRTLRVNEARPQEPNGNGGNGQGGGYKPRGPRRSF